MGLHRVGHNRSNLAAAAAAAGLITFQGSFSQNQPRNPKDSRLGHPVIRPSAQCICLVVQSLSCVQLPTTPWTAARQASLSFTVSQSVLKLMSIGSVIPSKHLILRHPLLPLPSIFPSIRVFSSELALCIRWPKYWSYSFSISSSNEYSGMISFRIK